MKIDLKDNRFKRLLMLLEVAAFLFLATWISKVYVAESAGRTHSVASLEHAVKLDPSNSDYHLRLSRLFQYSLTEFNMNRAVVHLKRATELDPLNPQAWLDLGSALESQGNTAEAEACLRRADFLAPNLVAYQWSVGNFFLLHGDVDEAFRHFQSVLSGTGQYNQVIFSIAWKATDDPDKVLKILIPHHSPTEFDYLNYLLSRQRYPEAQRVWRRIRDGSESFSAAQAAPYIDNLIAAHRVTDAYEVWADLRNRQLIKPTYQETSQNLIINGDFEEDPSNIGFDWRIAGVEGVYAGADDSAYHSPNHALLIQFPGNQNIEYRHFYQYVRVSPGRSYQLRGFMRTEGITTDSGPRLEVRDAYNSNALDVFSEALTGSSGGWRQLTLSLTTGAKTELVIVGVARLMSRKFDNKIAGKIWVDDLTLSEVPRGAAQGGRHPGS